MPSAPLGPGDAVCNACGKVGRSSDEHYLHAAIGRVVLGDRDLSGEDVRRDLREGRLAEFRRKVSNQDERKSFLASAVIRNLICERCNGQWANELELKASRALFAFLLDDGPANARVLRRWAWWFGMKTWWLDSRTEALRSGDLFPVLSVLAQRGSSVSMVVRVARLHVDPGGWDFAVFIHPGPSVFEYIVWVLRGSAWIILPRDPAGRDVLPFESRELVDGLRFKHVPRIPPGALTTLPAVKAAAEGRTVP